jgi:fucose 4-O-acetylase-like acetyltransferase
MTVGNIEKAKKVAAPGQGGKASRRLDLDRAKGLGILLVVVGHLGARSVPAGNAWYAYLQTALYQFHMPFFMMLSGYVSMMTGAAMVSSDAWPRLVARRAERLLLPFALFGLFILVGKLVAARFMAVDNMPQSFWAGLSAMVWDTDHSPALSVWYVAVLFVIIAIVPPLLWALRASLPALLAVAVVVYFLPLPHVLYLDRVGRYLLFFVVGLAAAELGGRWCILVDRWWPAFLAAFAAVLAWVVANFAAVDERLRLLACGLLAIVAFHGLVRSRLCSGNQWLLVLGNFSFVIYLLNTPFIGLAKGVMLKVSPWDGYAFLVFAPVMTFAGIAGPMLLKRYAFRRLPALDRLTT